MPAPAPPEVVEAAIVARAQGASLREIARDAGVSHGAVHNWVRKLEDRLDDWRVRLKARWTRKVLDDVDGVTAAQIAAASDPACRHGPQAARVLLEGAGVIGQRGGPLVSIDMRQQHVTLQAGAGDTLGALSLDELRARVESKLG